jgi:hypothetical protein
MAGPKKNIINLKNGIFKFSLVKSFKASDIG